MYKVIIGDEAKQDLKDTYDYVLSETYNPSISKSVIDEFYGVCLI